MIRFRDKPGNCPWLQPYLVVRDADRSREFYKAAFGFEETTRLAMDDGSVGHLEYSYKGEILFMAAPEAASKLSAPATSGTAAPLWLHCYVDDVDALTEQARAAGAEVLGEPEDQFYGDRRSSIRDLNGFVWFFASNFADPPANA